MATQAETAMFTDWALGLIDHLQELDDTERPTLGEQPLVQAGPPVDNNIWVTVTDNVEGVSPRRGVTVRLEPWGDWEEHPEDGVDSEDEETSDVEG